MAIAPGNAFMPPFPTTFMPMITTAFPDPVSTNPDVLRTGSWGTHINDFYGTFPYDIGFMCHTGAKKYSN
jgi:hypothetical protein